MKYQMNENYGLHDDRVDGLDGDDVHRFLRPHDDDVTTTDDDCYNAEIALVPDYWLRICNDWRDDTALNEREGHPVGTEKENSHNKSRFRRLLNFIEFLK